MNLKKMLAASAACLILGSLTACAGPSTEKDVPAGSETPANPPAASSAASSAGTQALPEKPSEESPEKPSEELPAQMPQEEENTSSGDETMRAAYATALENLRVSHRLPDAQQDLGPDDNWPDGATYNHFAVFDVDMDGKDELLVEYTNTFMAGQAAAIYGFDEDSDTLHRELLEFPMWTFYDNGVITVGWSHNQGYAGDALWPYTVYRYDGTTDTYLQVGMVDAWDRTLSQTYYEGTAFPTDVDQDGDGIVYLLTQDGKETTVDGAAYLQWRDAQLGGAQKMTIPFVSLTDENIAALS